MVAFLLRNYIYQMNNLALSGSDESTLIRAWGESWSRRAVDWKSGKIKAERRHFRGTSKERYVDIWKQRGIYALENEFKIVYVGQANDRDLGQRLREHTTDRLRQRWDTFSWYGLLPMRPDGTLQDYTSQEVNKASISERWS